MTSRKKQLQFCKICNYQKFDFKRGIICGLTERAPNFKDTCPFFSENKELKQQIETAKAHVISSREIPSKDIRALNFFIDFTCYFILAITLRYITEIALLIISPSTASSFHEFAPLRDLSILAALYFSYYVFFEATTGKTIAKYITNTRVVNKEGEHPSFIRILIRSVARLIPFDFITFIMTRESKGWHDRFSGTHLVKEI